MSLRPEMFRSPAARATVLVCGAVALFAAPVLLAIAAPLCDAAGWSMPADAARGAFATICHQDAARSFELMGFPMGACTRCSGFYAGLAIGAAALAMAGARGEPWNRRWTIALACLAVPGLVHPLLSKDAGIPLLSPLVSDAPWLRAGSAFLAGVAAVLFVLPVLISSVRSTFLSVEATRREKA